MMDGSYAVELVGIGKTFPGVIANHDVNVTIRPAMSSINCA